MQDILVSLQELDWQQEPLTATSPAMIYVCQRHV